MAGVKAKTIFRDLELADPAVKHRPDKGEIRKLLSMAGVVIVPGDNIQDAFNDASADGVDCYITGGAGAYNPVGSITIPEGLSMRPFGNPLINSNFNGPIFTAEGLQRFSMLGEMRLAGTGPDWVYKDPYPITTPADPYDVSSFQSGIHTLNCLNFLIGDGIEITNMGAGVHCEAPTLGFPDQGRRTIRALMASDCAFAFHMMNYGEYCRMLDVVGKRSNYGLYDESGNVIVGQSTFTYNNVGIRIDGDLQQNEGHGIVSDTMVNHCDYSFYFYKLRIGHTVTNCYGLGTGTGGGTSKIGLVDARGVSIKGGSYGPALTLDATSSLLFEGVNVRTDLAPSVTVASGGLYIGRNNHHSESAGGIGAAGLLGAPWNN
jgi:hypothetical protein